MRYSSREIVGISLWWAEGTKSRLDKRWKLARSYPIEVTNTDPKIIKLFLLFLEHDIGIPRDRIRVQIQVHEGDDKAALELYWSEITGVPITKFNKTIVRPVGRKIGKTRGTCKVRFADKQTYLKLEAFWTKLASEVLSSI